MTRRATTPPRPRPAQSALRPLGRPSVLLLLWASVWLAPAAPAQESLARIVERVEPTIVKIYGAGGLAGLEAYQSGVLISPEGHVLTVFSYVLDTDDVTAVLHDGRRFKATVLGHDPRVEIALLKIPVESVPFINLDERVDLLPGAPILALSNLFNIAFGEEPASVQAGIVTSVTNLAARRGAFATPYQGRVYVLDAMTNNPGAAGGLLIDRSGRPAGLLGKELQSADSTIYLNFAIPLHELIASVDAIREGRLAPRPLTADVILPPDPTDLSQLGIVLMPAVLDRTPPFVDRLRLSAPAARAGLRPDDLIVFVGDQIVASEAEVRRELTRIDRSEPVRLTVQRDGQLVVVEIPSRP